MKKLLILLIGFFILLSFNLPALAIKLEGRVTNQVDGKAIAGASIQLLKDGRATEYRTATDYDGRFAIINLPKGTYDVVIFHPEYIKKRIRRVEVEPNQANILTREELAIEPAQSLIVNEKTPPRVNEINHSRLRRRTIPEYPAQRLLLEAYYIQLNPRSIQPSKPFREKDSGFLRYLKEILKNHYGLEFTPDSIHAKGLLTVSLDRFANGRVKQVLTMYTHKQPMGEVGTLFRNTSQIDDHTFIRRVAEDIFALLRQITAGLPLPSQKKQVVTRPEPESIRPKFDPTKFSGPRGLARGQVLEKKTKEPMIGVRVRLLLADGTSARMGAVTDEKGNFLVLNVPPGTYQIEASYGPTYNKQLIKEVKIEANETYEAGIIQLTEKPFEGDTVYVKNPCKPLIK